MKVVNDIEHAAGEGNCSVLVALDISAAFDAVDHLVLCKRAKVELALTAQLWTGYNLFVTDRSQFIAVGGERSETAILSSGVPQGSTLGKLLFALYVSPIDNVIRSRGTQYHQHMDDLMLYTALATNMFNVLSSLTE